MMAMSTIQVAIPTTAVMAGYVGEVALGPWAEVLGAAVLVGVVSIWVAAWRTHRLAADTPPVARQRTDRQPANRSLRKAA